MPAVAGSTTGGSVFELTATSGSEVDERRRQALFVLLLQTDRIRTRMQRLKKATQGCGTMCSIRLGLRLLPIPGCEYRLASLRIVQLPTRQNEEPPAVHQQGPACVSERPVHRLLGPQRLKSPCHPRARLTTNCMRRNVPPGRAISLRVPSPGLLYHCSRCRILPQCRLYRRVLCCLAST